MHHPIVYKTLLAFAITEPADSADGFTSRMLVGLLPAPRHIRRNRMRILRGLAGPLLSQARHAKLRDVGGLVWYGLQHQQPNFAEPARRLKIAAHALRNTTDPFPTPTRLPAPLPPAPSPRPRRARRKRKARAQAPPAESDDGEPPRACWLRVSKKRWAKRVDKALAAASLPGAVFVTLTWPTPPSENERRLARLPKDRHRQARTFVDAIRRAKARYYVTIATRSETKTWYPHAHAIIAGLDVENIQKAAEKAGLVLAYAQPVQAPIAAARDVTSARQSKIYDKAEGRVTWGNVREFTAVNFTPKPPADWAKSLTVDGLPPEFTLRPGLRVVNPARFLTALDGGDESTASHPVLRLDGD